MARKKKYLVQLGHEIAKARKRMGWRQADLALMCQVSRITVARWESGVNAPTLENIMDLYAHLRLDVNTIFPTIRRMWIAGQATRPARTPKPRPDPKELPLL